MESRVNRIAEVINKIEPNKVTILTGSNGSGKSLIRKQLCFKLARKIEGADYRHLTVDVSMQRRTETNAELGALSQFMHDDATDPTSLSTFQFVETLFNSFVTEREKKRYIIIDEPEIGMAKESQLGFVLWLKEQLPEIMSKTHGLLIITHSELIVEQLKDLENVEFINMDSDCTAEEWINREIIPTDFIKLAKDSRELYLALEESGKNKR